jgi:hypothetical protein
MKRRPHESDESKEQIMSRMRSWLHEWLPEKRERLVNRLGAISRPLAAAGDLNSLLDRIGDARYVSI